MIKSLGVFLCLIVSTAAFGDEFKGYPVNFVSGAHSLSFQLSCQPIKSRSASLTEDWLRKIETKTSLLICLFDEYVIGHNRACSSLPKLIDDNCSSSHEENVYGIVFNSQTPNGFIALLNLAVANQLPVKVSTGKKHRIGHYTLTKVSLETE